jgi:hypothetical protein
MAIFGASKMGSFLDAHIYLSLVATDYFALKLNTASQTVCRDSYTYIYRTTVLLEPVIQLTPSLLKYCLR